MNANPGASGKRDIGRAFGIKGSAKIALKKILKDMEREGTLKRKRKTLSTAEGLPAVTTIQVLGFDEDGELYGSPQDWNSDQEKPLVLIGKSRSTHHDTRPPKAGDVILAKIEATPLDERYRYTAHPMKNMSGNATRMLGVMKTFGGERRILPVDKKSRNDLAVMRDQHMDAADGELVSVEIVKDGGRGLPLARVREKLGDMNDPRNISLIAINQHGVPNHFPDRVIAESEALEPFTQSKREDFRKLPLITIDPSDARDHDDAVHAVADANADNQGGFIVTVAIADVATYVKSGSQLDREAKLRGNSTYFPDRVVPMLPERISNHLCSLVEAEDRPALAVVMRFDKSGIKLGHKFHRITMRSAAKLSYQDAQNAIDGKPNDKTGVLVNSVLKPLWAAYHAVSKARDKRGPLALDLPERKIIMDGKGGVAQVIVPERLDAHRLIEEFMIQANVAAAEELEKHRSPLLYRVHDEPDPAKIKSLASFLKTVGQDWTMGQVLKPKAFNRLLDLMKETEHERVVHEVVLRTQSQAQYRPTNIGHFGLNLAKYAHFTSPIRRYADLIVHRALISALKLGDDGLSQDDIATLEATAEQISAAERRSMLAERETTDRLIAAHLQSHIGATFKGRISGVVSAGLFVQLIETGADGFVPASTLGKDYYIFEETQHALIGRSTGEMFQLGDTVEVKLQEVTPVKGGMKFEIVSEGRKAKIMPKGRGGHRLLKKSTRPKKPKGKR